MFPAAQCNEAALCPTAVLPRSPLLCRGAISHGVGGDCLGRDEWLEEQRGRNSERDERLKLQER
ncbi:hypothetical protein E2C01_084081 [Portunus trituberculatus]|uniref:Uncharacterized protein n=1 Tax=Portunus trituberculatus TaxID=210409 RepID=A0A5B7J6H7_PORTR|nr:hypothetical protein [Portunus trituberculatus]